MYAALTPSSSDALRVGAIEARGGERRLGDLEAQPALARQRILERVRIAEPGGDAPRRLEPVVARDLRVVGERVAAEERPVGIGHRAGRLAVAFGAHDRGVGHQQIEAALAEDLERVVERDRFGQYQRLALGLSVGPTPAASSATIAANTTEAHRHVIVL